MAKKPRLVPNEYFDDLAGDETPVDSTSPQESYVYYTDGHPVVSVDDLNEMLKDEVRKKYIKCRAIDIFTECSDKPELTKRLAEEYFTESLGLKAVEEGSLQVYQGVSSLTGTELETVIILSARTIDQFAGMFWSNLIIFDPSELQLIEDAATDSIAISLLAQAFYEHILSDSTDSERDYKRHVRAARRLLKGIIGADDLTYSAEPDETRQIFGGIAFRTMLEKLRQSGYSEDPGFDLIESNRAQKCLRALRATGDDYFVGIAAAKEPQTAESYLRAVVNHRFPRSL